MGDQSWPGRDGIHIQESGLAVPTCRSEWVSESVGTAVLAGAGVIGDLTGITITRFITTADTSPEAERFITAAAITAAEDLMALGAGLAVSVAALMLAPALPPGLSMETVRRLEDMPNRAVRAASVRAPSAAMSMADRREAFRHAEARASVAAGRAAAALVVVAGVANPTIGG